MHSSIDLAQVRIKVMENYVCVKSNLTSLPDYRIVLIAIYVFLR